MSDPAYIVGIDLGTTHCVVAYRPIEESGDETAEIQLFDIPQVIEAGEVQARPLLPSFLLLPSPHEVPREGLALPWDSDMDYAVGEFARRRGGELPHRAVASAKSWLCHAGVDRTEPILPWEAQEDSERISPLEATTRLLSHIRAAWNHRMAGDNNGARLEDQDLYLTVPASFDAVARELTAQAARAAGLENLTLLEEPTAAFYAWLDSQKGGWRQSIAVGDTILVCDVGGGTTDFSLIEVAEEAGKLTLKRAAVGEHILLGGDNMDLTLAYTIQAKLAEKGTQLSAWQLRGLWYSCRQAKERLLSDPDRATEPVVILGRGSSLIGGTIRTELTREEVQAVLLEGFFPRCEADEFPQEKSRVGMREMGLPYAADVAVTRHLAAFLGRQIASEQPPSSTMTFPSAVLFNGGVMKAPALRQRVKEVLQSWRGEPLRELPSVDLDLAVALGGAYYGLARRDRGIRIRAGVPRTYYIGIESAMPAVPGIPTPMKALCVVPFGMEEGSSREIRQKEFGLVIGEPATFHLLASTHRQEDRAGQIVEDWSGDIQEVASLEAHLSATGTDSGGTVLPVWLESTVTEVGTLELWCVSRDDERRWKLEFNIREV